MFTFDKTKMPKFGEELPKWMKYYRIFFINSDESLLPFIDSEWGYIKSNTIIQLKQGNPKLYNEITTYKFFEQFKNHIQEQYITEIKQFFYEFKNPYEELSHFNEWIKDFKSKVSECRQKKLITSFSEKYINELSSILSELREELNQKYSEKPNPNTSTKETVFGKNFDFITSLYEDLCLHGFIDKSKCAKEQFSNHFYIDSVPDKPITLIGNNLSDLGLLIIHLGGYFKEDYQISSDFNSFWAERFLFSTKGGSYKPKSKDKDSVSKIISEAKKGKRKSTKSNAISEIGRNS
jgi:hypothetical protein